MFVTCSVARNLEQNGVTELSAEDVLDKIKNTRSLRAPSVALRYNAFPDQDPHC